MTRPGRLASVIVFALLLVAAVTLMPDRALPQGTTSDADRYFRVEIDPEPVPRGGWAVQGYVYSTHAYRVNGVRLEVDVLDEAGQVARKAYGWVPGDIPAGGRAYFFVSLPARGAAYRGKVISYFLVSHGGS